MDTSGFYKLNEILLYAPTTVHNEQYTLCREEYKSYTYPVDGWYWFYSEELARDFFELPLNSMNSDKDML